MLHFLHLLVANFVCLLFDAGQVVYNFDFSELFFFLLAKNSFLLQLEIGRSERIIKANQKQLAKWAKRGFKGL